MIRALTLAFALGLIVVPVSEMMFWPVPAAHSGRGGAVAGGGGGPCVAE